MLKLTTGSISFFLNDHLAVVILKFTGRDKVNVYRLPFNSQKLIFVVGDLILYCHKSAFLADQFAKLNEHRSVTTNVIGCHGNINDIFF